MKTLYLIRHAKSSWKDLTLDDFDRPLNGRGKRDAPFMGKKLAERGEKIDGLVSSPAKRAITTARNIAKELGHGSEIIQKREIYHASSSTILQIVNELDNEHDSVVLFGHNPGFTDFLNELSNSDIYNMPTCGMARIDFEFAEWAMISRETGKLIWFDYPKRYPELQDQD